MPVCWIIAGPNGAGKTTFALNFLPQIANCTHFVNADLIAAGLSPLAPERDLISASKLFIQEIKQHIVRKNNFSFETTLSGRGHLRLIKQLQQEGWSIELIYLALPSVNMSKSRVAERVAHGGHHIPAYDIERRFPRSLRNLLTDFSELADSTLCYMNIGDTPELIFEQNDNQRHVVHDEYYQLIVNKARL